MACKRSSVRIRYPPRLLDKAIALIRDGFFWLVGIVVGSRDELVILHVDDEAITVKA
jgi:hypothetical protein